MASRHRYHQFILPSRCDQDTVASILCHRKTCVIQIFMQTLDLLPERHLKQTYLNFGVLFTASRQQVDNRAGVTPSDTAMRNWPKNPLAADLTPSRADPTR